MDGATSLLSDKKVATTAAIETTEEPARPEDEALELMQVDRVSLEIGYRLIPLVQDKNGTGILDHISQLRRRFAMKTTSRTLEVPET